MRLVVADTSPLRYLVLDLAARRGLVDLVDVFDRLKGTNFRYRQSLFDALLKKHEDRGAQT